MGERSLPDGSTNSTRRVAVIGAGPAGLVTAKTFLAAGADVTVFERGSHIGGTWVYDNDNGRRFLYKNLHINTSKRLTAFEGLPFPDDTQPIPDHRDMAAYLKAYSEKFGITGRTLFNANVVKVVPAAHGGDGSSGWIVHAEGRTEDKFDAVAVCTGAFDRPRHVAQFAQEFGGEYLHSADYREPEPFTGKRVCIIGAGNSASDIASDICRIAARTVMVARSPVFVTPHFILGFSLNDISRNLQRRWIPDAVRRGVTRALVRVVHGRMEQHGFKPLTHRVHPTINSTIIQDILFHRVAIKQGVTQVDGRAISFADGSVEEFDTVIAATGFVTAFPFLDRTIVGPEDEALLLYKRIVPPGWRSLYFVGMINLDTPVNYACERQARWIAEFEMNALPLPSKAEMAADIAAKRDWVTRIYGDAQRHSVQEESRHYYRELDLALRQSRRKKFRNHPSWLRARFGRVLGASPLRQEASRPSVERRA